MPKNRPVKKVQKSIHFDPVLFDIISERRLITKRTISGEIEVMLLRLLEIEKSYNDQALAMANPRIPQPPQQ